MANQTQNTNLAGRYAIGAAVVSALIAGAFLLISTCNTRTSSQPQSLPSVQSPAPPFEEMFTGRITDKVTKKPVADASVTLIGIGSPINTLTDSNGVFQASRSKLINGLSISIDVEGYEPKTITIDPSNRTEQIILNPDESPKPEYSLAPEDPPIPEPSPVESIAPKPSPSKPVKKETFLDQISPVVVKLYGDKYDQTAEIRGAFDGLFSEKDEDLLANNEKYFRNYCRFCFIALSLHADEFTNWFQKSSSSQRRDFFLAMKKAVLSDNFRPAANKAVDKVGPGLHFTPIGDYMTKKVSTDILQRISTGK